MARTASVVGTSSLLCPITTTIDLLTVAEAALVGVRAAAEAKDIDLRLSGDPAKNIVLGDADRMQQVFWNLFLNAVKFTPQGGSVRISVGRASNQVHVRVIDSGRGIQSDFLPYVFDRFRQAEGSSNRTQMGLGLGLTLVRELVELHGGTEPPPASLSGAALLALPSQILDGTKVLVVDDEADARDALVSLLERYGAQVRAASSVAEALAAFAIELPDVLISDLGMPGGDGYELIRRVKLLSAKAGGSVPSLAVSAYATDAHRRQVMRSGFQKHLEKPVAPATLVREVARLAGRLEPVN
jgi:CheY-like chemotaxis protein